MTILLHILKKDIRRHWPEIAASIAIVAVYLGYQPRLWAQKEVELRLLGKMAGILPVLMVLTWAFLIVRVVQGEALVGDRQFWITRPYQWHKLLAAKLVFIFLFVHLPLFFGQMILLNAARFPVWSSLSGLFTGHLFLDLAIVLPAFTLACITRGIGQATLTLVSIIAIIIAGAWGANSIFSMAMTVDWSDHLQESLYVLGGIAVILVQFAFRRTKWSWVIVLVVTSAIFLLVFFTPYNASVSRIFPLPTHEYPLPVQFTRDPDLTFLHTGDPEQFGDMRTVQIPLDLASFAENMAVEVRGTKLEMSFDDGGHWSSGWRTSYGSILADRTRFWPELRLTSAEFNGIHNRRGKAHLSLALDVYRMGRGTKIQLAGDTLALPGGARCVYQSTTNSLRCFAALHEPDPIILTAELPSSTCRVKPRADFEGWADTPAAYVSLTENGGEPILSPVQEFAISLQRFYAFEDLQAPLPICAGTPITWSVPKFAYSTRAEIDLGEVTLDDYHPSYPRQILPSPPNLPRTSGAGTLSQNRDSSSKIESHRGV